MKNMYPTVGRCPMEILSKFEELILLSTWRLEENAYGTTIYNYIKDVTGKKLSLGGVYFPLDRLTKKGYLESYIGEATPERKGLSKRYYSLTERGIQALGEIKRVNEIMWAGFPDRTFSALETG
jgi:DNA-binding PadR family transcriptional regulator